MKLRGDQWTLVLINLAGIMESADEALLPAVYKEVGAALGVTPTGLGSLTLLRSIVQTLCYPIAAYLALQHDRTHVVAVGAFLWAAATFLVAISNTFLQFAISRALNGIGLALVIPSMQSLVADSADESKHGTAFGWLYLTANFGAIIGNFAGILLASTSFMGIAGWRIAFHLVAILSIIVGILVWVFAVDPHFPKNSSSSGKPASKMSISTELKELKREAKAVIRIPTFQIIVAQGIPGSIPGHALAFVPMWLELIGFSHKDTGIIMTLYQVARSFGGLFGGKMGDLLAMRLPNAGRIIMAQISSSSYISLGAILFLALPDNPSTGVSHALVLIIMGLMVTWCAPATNNPIFAEIVPERSRTSIYALDRCFESLLASFAPSVVGILAENAYGYKPVPKGSGEGEEILLDRENAVPLAKALYTTIAISVSLCCSIYSLLYCTYPRDRDQAKMYALIQSEIQQLELQTCHGLGNYSEIKISELDHHKEGSTDTDHTDNFAQTNNTDETRLLHQQSVPN